jgi:hypothetical protein
MLPHDNSNFSEDLSSTFLLGKTLAAIIKLNPKMNKNPVTMTRI